MTMWHKLLKQATLVGRIASFYTFVQSLFMRVLGVFFLVLLAGNIVKAQSHQHVEPHAEQSIYHFIENRGQWDERISFQTAFSWRATDCRRTVTGL